MVHYVHMSYVSDLHKQTHSDVDAFLYEVLKNKIQESSTIDSSYSRLWEVISSVTLQGGKRLRPYLTLISSNLNGADNKSAMPIAVSQELLHLSLLIHDDVIDKDTVRHGAKNINGRYADIYSGNASDNNVLHSAFGASIIAGDLLISFSYQLINDSELSATKKNELMSLLSKSIFEVAAGQLMDIEAAFMKESYDPITIYRYKTSGYSFVVPLLTGAILSDCSEEVKKALEEYGINLGIAYQLQDDILGVFGDEVITGKSASCDLREAKRTYLIESFLGLAQNDDKKIFDSIFGDNQASDESVANLRSIIEKSGAKSQTFKTMQEYSQKAKNALNILPDSSQKTELLNLVDMLTERDS